MINTQTGYLSIVLQTYKQKNVKLLGLYESWGTLLLNKKNY